MVGRRLPDQHSAEEPGDYAKITVDGVTCWIIKVPTGGPACIIGRPNRDGSPNHWVRENEDGSITVEPYPPDAPPERRNSNSIQWNGWHGYIRQGVWEAC